MKQYKVWTCKLVVDADEPLPWGFDAPPRQAAMRAVQMHGIPVLDIFSGWGGELDEIERQIVERDRSS